MTIQLIPLQRYTIFDDISVNTPYNRSGSDYTSDSSTIQYDMIQDKNSIREENNSIFDDIADDTIPYDTVE